MLRTPRSCLLALILSLAGCASKRPAALPEPEISSNAAADVPIYARDSSGMDRLQRLLSPCFARAKETYPGAKQRYLSGQSGGRPFFVSVNLHDPEGRVEQVFLVVDTIRTDSIRGRIWNEVNLVRGFQLKQSIVVPESSVLDWAFANPDGSEEGNYVGRAVDEIQAGRKPNC